MTVQGIESVVSQMQAIATQTRDIQPFNQNAMQPQATNFGDELERGVKKINEMQLNTTNISNRFTQGEPGIGINDVMVSMQKSSVALNMGVQVRNKLIAAYQNIMSINI